MLDINCIKKLYIYFRPDLVGRIEGQKLTANFSVNFDHEPLEAGNWQIHIDVTYSLNTVAEILTRSTFQVRCEEDWMFAEGVLLPTVKMAVENCFQGFREQCDAYNISFKEEWIKIPDQTLDILRDHVIKLYKGRGRITDKNPEMYKNSYFHMTPGGNTQALVNGSLIVMDLLLSESRHVDVKANRSEILKAGLPYPWYLTAKIRCMKLSKKQTVYLSMVYFIAFYHSMDCACQVLLSDVSDGLSQEMTDKGLTEDFKKYFLKQAIEFMKSQKQQMVARKHNVTSIQKQIDWVGILDL